MPSSQITVTCEYAAASGALTAPECPAGAGRPEKPDIPGGPPLLPGMLEECFRLFVRQSLAAGQQGAVPSSPENGR